MTMNPLFESIAACPRCHGALAWEDEAVACTKTECGRRYLRIDGIPVLDDAASTQPEDWRTPPPAPRGALLRLKDRLLRVESHSYKTAHSADRLPRFVASLGSDAIVLNVGSGTTHFGDRVINLDIGPFRNVDVVGTGETLPVVDGCLDAVITQGVLEHVPDLVATLHEIDRVLKPGGLVCHEVPFIQGFHGTVDHRRFTWQGVRQLAADYEILEEGVAVGPSSAVAWVLAEWLSLLFSFGRRRPYGLLQQVFSKLLLPLTWADAWLEPNPDAKSIACALYVTARKPARPALEGPAGDTPGA